MVILNIFGGLGNQMFQYAAGRALAIRRETGLYLDVASFQRYSIHQGFELNRLFALNVQAATEDTFKNVLGWQRSPFIRRMLYRDFMRFVRKRNYISEPHFEYWEGIKNAPDSCYLSGYWQSERYFTDVAEKIRKDFAFLIPLDGENLKLSQQIIGLNSVSLHVRRGDYILDPKNAKIYHACTAEYYGKAIELLMNMVQNPRFFIFSDDIEWAKQNLDIGRSCTYVAHNRGTDSYIDMQLMSLCKHHIIANSSFSWWGAWLNPCSDKVVVAPSMWFNSEINTGDLLPLDWLLV